MPYDYDWTEIDRRLKAGEHPTVIAPACGVTEKFVRNRAYRKGLVRWDFSVRKVKQTSNSICGYDGNPRGTLAGFAAYAIENPIYFRSRFRLPPVPVCVELAGKELGLK